MKPESNHQPEGKDDEEEEDAEEAIMSDPYLDVDEG